MASIDTSELEYLISCRDKLQDIAEILGQEEEGDNNRIYALEQFSLKILQNMPQIAA